MSLKKVFSFQCSDGNKTPILTYAKERTKLGKYNKTSIIFIKFPQISGNFFEITPYLCGIRTGLEETDSDEKEPPENESSNDGGE